MRLIVSYETRAFPNRVERSCRGLSAHGRVLTDPFPPACALFVIPGTRHGTFLGHSDEEQRRALNRRALYEFYQSSRQPADALAPAETHDIVLTRDIQIPMPDGVVLLADHYVPRTRSSKLPTLLLRSPYGRRGLFGALTALPYAERGYQVLVQSCHGTAGSGGQFLYTRNEHADGLATIAWVKQQEWFSGELATLGGSYLGFVQWAEAAEAGPELKAMVAQVTTSDFNHFRYQGGSFNLEASLGWSTTMTT